MFTSPSSKSHKQHSSHSFYQFIVRELTFQNIFAALCGGVSAKLCLDKDARRYLKQEAKRRLFGETKIEDLSDDLVTVYEVARPVRRGQQPCSESQLFMQIVLTRWRLTNTVIRAPLKLFKQCIPAAKHSFAEKLEALINSHEAAYWNRLGVYLLNSDTSHFADKDTDAVECFSKAAELGFAPALYNLALCHHFGLQTKADISKAITYYSRAAVKGHVLSIHNLAVVLLQRFESDGLLADYAKALALLRFAAAKHYTPSIRLLQIIRQKSNSAKWLQTLFEHFRHLFGVYPIFDNL